MSDQATLEVRNLQTHFFTKAGVVKAVNDVSFSVGKGKILGLVGESGSGKTVTGFSILGLVDEPGRVCGGEILYRGENLVGASQERMRQLRGNNVAMIFQDPMMTLNPVLRIDTQMIEAIKAHHKVSDDEARQRARDALGQVGIPSPDERLRSYPHQFSGGMRQRVAIAIALLNKPDLIVADEPTTALDVTIQAQILHLLAELRKEFNSALILITHDLGVVARVADKVAVMYAGKIVEAGTVEEIFNKPLHPYTQGLINCIPVPGKTARGSRLGSIPGIVPTLIGDIKGCSFRNRCAFAHDACDTTDPYHTLAPGRGYRCTLDVATCEANAKELVSA